MKETLKAERSGRRRIGVLEEWMEGRGGKEGSVWRSLRGRVNTWPLLPWKRVSEAIWRRLDGVSI